MILYEEGLENTWARHRAIAHAVWAALDKWGGSEENASTNAPPAPIRHHVCDRTLRSHAVTALSIGSSKGTELRHWLSQNTGVTLGIGLGMAEDNVALRHQFMRIGHMGHVNFYMISGVLASVEAGMRALEIPFSQSGVNAAIEAFTDVHCAHTRHTLKQDALLETSNEVAVASQSSADATTTADGCEGCCGG